MVVSRQDSGLPQPPGVGRHSGGGLRPDLALPQPPCVGRRAATDWWFRDRTSSFLNHRAAVETGLRPSSTTGRRLSAEGQRLRGEGDGLGAGGGEAAAVVLATEHLVGDVGGRLVDLV